MPNAASRKNKATDEPTSTSPTKRPRNASVSDNSSSSTTATDDVRAEETLTPLTSLVDAADNDGASASEPTATLDVPDYVPEGAIPRLERLRLVCEPRFNRYGITAIPADADWGKDATKRWSPYEHLLCHHGTPVVVWMLGVARWVHLTDNRKYTIGIQPLCEQDADAARRNSVGRCEPYEAPKEESTLTYANRWIVSKRRDGVEQTFDEVYDAVDHELRGWDADHKTSTDRVRSSDVVVVEFYIRRFRNKNLNAGRSWSAWKVDFDLLRIALIVEGPGPLVLPPPDSSAVI